MLMINDRWSWFGALQWMILDWMVILFDIADGDVLIHKHHSACHLTDDQRWSCEISERRERCNVMKICSNEN